MAYAESLHLDLLFEFSNEEFILLKEVIRNVERNRQSELLAKIAEIVNLSFHKKAYIKFSCSNYQDRSSLLK